MGTNSENLVLQHNLGLNQTQTSVQTFITSSQLYNLCLPSRPPAPGHQLPRLSVLSGFSIAQRLPVTLQHLHRGSQLWREVLNTSAQTTWIGGVFEGWLGHEGGTLLIRTIFKKKRPQRALLSLCHMRTQGENDHLWTRKLSPDI